MKSDNEKKLIRIHTERIRSATSCDAPSKDAMDAFKRKPYTTKNSDNIKKIKKGETLWKRCSEQ